MSNAPVVLVTVGSDHHPFDRLVGWVDSWAAERRDAVEVVVQHGTSRPPAHAGGDAYLDHDRLQDLMRRAAVVVTQGGPMSIIEARRAGRLPVVVPRDPRLGEHVDGHQQAFCRRLEAEGLITCPDDEQKLQLLLDQGCADPASLAAEHDETAVARVEAAVTAIGRIVEDAVNSPGSRTPVLMISGSGRSGSTLFERALAQAAPAVALGETLHAWERAVRDDESCACGLPFHACPFWRAVGNEAFGGWQHLPADQLVDLRHAVVRTRRIPNLLTVGTSTTWRLQRDRLARTTGAVMAAARNVAGAELVIDSSKLPAYAAMLLHAPVDLRCVFVVRDPRGVAYSLQKSVPRPEAHNGDLMHRSTPVQTAAWWNAYPLLYDALRIRGIPTMTIRYEDFVAQPAATVETVLRFAGMPADRIDTSGFDGSRLQLTSSHQVAGNPMRFTSGEVRLSADLTWQVRLGPRERQLVTRLTAPLRRRYGYR